MVSPTAPWILESVTKIDNQSPSFRMKYDENVFHLLMYQCLRASSNHLEQERRCPDCFAGYCWTSGHQAPGPVVPLPPRTSHRRQRPLLDIKHGHVLLRTTNKYWESDHRRPITRTNLFWWSVSEEQSLWPQQDLADLTLCLKISLYCQSWRSPVYCSVIYKRQSQGLSLNAHHCWSFGVKHCRSDSTNGWC